MNSQDLSVGSSFDSIVILSASNWFKELRSNRYHYASRFARSSSVWFVQPDLHYKGYQLEDTEFDAIKVIHVWKRYDKQQTELLNAALDAVGAKKSLFWIYNGQFYPFIVSREAVLKVYHATEDYFSADSYILTPRKQLAALNNLLKECQLLVCVSEGVADSYRQKSAFVGTSITITNGCDYAFYAPQRVEPALQRIVFYQGNIFDKLDYELLITLALRMPTWQFQFCGRVLFNETGWKQLLSMPNVAYLGVLTPEQIRTRSYQATVGIIPFVESAFLIERSLPLKAFEYLACGLPVVSVPIKALLPFRSVMQFASGADAFLHEIERAEGLRDEKAHRALRLKIASEQDYDAKVATVLDVIHTLVEKKLCQDAVSKPTEKLPVMLTKNRLFSMPNWIDCLLAGYDRIPMSWKDKIPAIIKRRFIKRFLS